MKRVLISDKTLRDGCRNPILSFREKIEVGKMLDRLGVDVIELGRIQNDKADCLLVKAIANTVRSSTVSVSVPLDIDGINSTWNAVKDAAQVRLQVAVPVSSVQMEYLLHMKPAALLKSTAEAIRCCRQYTDDVEFIAEDATRSDPEYLSEIINTAVQAGAQTVTLCDFAGQMLPDEFHDFLQKILKSNINQKQIRFGIDCNNTLHLAEACAIGSIGSGVREIKVSSNCSNCVSLPDLVHIINSRKETLGISCGVHTEELEHTIAQIRKLYNAIQSPDPTPFENSININNTDIYLTAYDTQDSIIMAAERLGYDLSDDDTERVWNSFCNIVEKKDKVTLKELDAIIATEAMQVPQIYKVQSYVINTGNITSSMAHMVLSYHDKIIEGISLGDGTIDAAFLAIEKATGKHFELDDFQIQAIAEGREAMGETVIKLRSNGKLYSGRGISTDIVGASIMSYISALNKIVYEEEEA